MKTLLLKMFQSYTEKVYRPDLKSIEPQFSQAQWYTCELCKDTTKNAWFSETDLQVHKKEAHFGIIKHRMITNADRFCTVSKTILNEVNHHNVWVFVNNGSSTYSLNNV